MKLLLCDTYVSMKHYFMRLAHTHSTLYCLYLASLIPIQSLEKELLHIIQDFKNQWLIYTSTNEACELQIVH